MNSMQKMLLSLPTLVGVKTIKIIFSSGVMAKSMFEPGISEIQGTKGTHATVLFNSNRKNGADCLNS
jgi:hypothetical protein